MEERKEERPVSLLISEEKPMDLANVQESKDLKEPFETTVELKDWEERDEHK